MPNPRNGIYMPNAQAIPADAIRRYHQAKFTWAVVRTDSHPDIARFASQRGARVIMQAPDCYNRYPPPSPWRHAQNILEALMPYIPYSDIVCLDNEPNLGAVTGTQWHAEQFTRWYRALVATFRFIDTHCRWRLAMPAICHPFTADARAFLTVGKENFLESEFISVHVYWNGHGHFVAGAPQETIQPYLDLYPAYPLLITEYGDADPTTPDHQEAQDYYNFVLLQPDRVLASCKFILHGTQDWQHFYLTDMQAQKLGTLPD